MNVVTFQHNECNHLMHSLQLLQQLKSFKGLFVAAFECNFLLVMATVRQRLALALNDTAEKKIKILNGEMLKNSFRPNKIPKMNSVEFTNFQNDKISTQKSQVPSSTAVCIRALS